MSAILIATFQRRQERWNQNKTRKNPTTTYPNPSLSFEEAKTGAACWNTDKKPMLVDGAAHGVSCEQGEGECGCTVGRSLYETRIHEYQYVNINT